jgi:hypothetical protein
MCQMGLACLADTEFISAFYGGTPYWLRAEPGHDRGPVDRIPVSHACAADRSFEVKLVRPRGSEIGQKPATRPAANTQPLLVVEVLCFAHLD